ncbi:isoprenyl transferase [Rhodopirellula sp. MGV]|uniref:isoprenyl transferase n=1 Tax=Rhodopirellula sp. MGV TaxID=2023130 RepID=UPI000B977658|nr:isoprenyl transferase [Rhodopirellula sp. MGV]OYP28923.1 di-trans,poly-cis-decaprenylcistransferase [Rhodopirellula sp. MGV]PNY36961.1 isoprenyl transferase [Rhodopirellula baltica]
MNAKDQSSDLAGEAADKRGPLPEHIAIIMDGNGRWAQARGMPRIEGHRRGVDTVRMVSETCTELGIGALTLYCLSSENWKRPQEELDFLMELLQQYLVEERPLIMKQNLRLQVIGRRDRLPEKVIAEIDETIRVSADNTGTKLVLAIDYGGRDELTRAAKLLCEDVQAGKLSIDQISEQSINDRLYTSRLPDVDLMIRTGGELRVSNFLLWQLSYAELWVTETCWPEFSRIEFERAMESFQNRDRRFGGLSVGQ